MSLKERLEEVFAGRPLVTVACGITSSHLGDERNLREFFAASEAVQALQQLGKNTLFLLFDDSLDPLTDRQLRVATSKDPALIAQFTPFCGKPLARIPDPFGCHLSYSQHFQALILHRFHALGIHPQLLDAARSYQGGLYAPYLKIIFERYQEIIAFLEQAFCGYALQKLFWMICPGCGYMNEVTLRVEAGGMVVYGCSRCGAKGEMPYPEVEGKLSWKLDCAVRWNVFGVDLEPFSKAYLDPKVGSYYVAQALSREFLGGREVWPLRYGQVRLEEGMGYRLLSTLPGGLVRALFVEHLESDITLTRDRVLQLARKFHVTPQLSYYHYVTQLLPLRAGESWATLKEEDIALAPKGLHFAAVMLNRHYEGYWPRKEVIENISPLLLEEVNRLIREALAARERLEDDSEAFRKEIHAYIGQLGEKKRPVTTALRQILSHESGLPIPRLLYIAPKPLLLTVLALLDLILEQKQTLLLESPAEIKIEDWDIFEAAIHPIH